MKFFKYFLISFFLIILDLSIYASEQPDNIFSYDLLIERKSLPQSLTLGGASDDKYINLTPHSGNMGEVALNNKVGAPIINAIRPIYWLMNKSLESDFFTHSYPDNFIPQVLIGKGKVRTRFGGSLARGGAGDAYVSLATLRDQNSNYYSMRDYFLKPGHYNYTTNGILNGKPIKLEIEVVLKKSSEKCCIDKSSKNPFWCRNQKKESATEVVSVSSKTQGVKIEALNNLPNVKCRPRTLSNFKFVFDGELMLGDYLTGDAIPKGYLPITKWDRELTYRRLNGDWSAEFSCYRSTNGSPAVLSSCQSKASFQELTKFIQGFTPVVKRADQIPSNVKVPPGSSFTIPYALDGKLGHLKGIVRYRLNPSFKSKEEKEIGNQTGFIGVFK